MLSEIYREGESFRGRNYRVVEGRVLEGQWRPKEEGKGICNSLG
jgi:hypothetical protein